MKKTRGEGYGIGFGCIIHVGFYFGKESVTTVTVIGCFLVFLRLNANIGARLDKSLGRLIMKTCPCNYRDFFQL